MNLLVSSLAFACFGPLAAAAPALAPASVVAAAPAAVAAPAKPKAAAIVAAPEARAGGTIFADLSDKAVVERVLAAIESITTLKADFAQIAPSGATSTGKFYLRRPGLLRFEYDRPSPILIVATGGTVFVRDNALETTDSYPVGKTPLRYLLKKRVELGEARAIAVDRGADTVAVTFASEDEDEGGELTVVMTAGLQLKEWVVRDPQNGETFVTLENVIAGEALPNRLFAAPETGSEFLKD